MLPSVIKRKKSIKALSESWSPLARKAVSVEETLTDLYCNLAFTCTHMKNSSI